MIQLVSFAPASYRVSAVVQCTADTLAVKYSLHGVVDRLVWPPRSLCRTERDGLYRSTCFEAFIALPGSQYWEINASPSGDWAYFWFEDYRVQAQRFNHPAPRITTELQTLEFSIALPPSIDRPLTLGLSAVIESAAGLDYWSLAHGADKPDFHRRESFKLSVG